MSIEIRRVPVTDASDLIFNMDQVIFTKPKIHLAARTKQDIDEAFGKCTIFLAYQGSRPVGFIGYKSQTENLVEITGIGVMPDEQGKGIGTRLLREVLKVVGAAEFFLVAHPENEQALHVYHKLGFVDTKLIDNYYGDGEPRLQLVLKKRT